jgi:ketosteroid isomerase-like protein
MKITCGRLAVVLLLTLMALASRADETVEQVLDGFHQAAAAGDFDAYFGRMTDEAVFLGTDATERWQGQAFRDFARPHFAKGGWTYVPTVREVAVDEVRGVAFFDELLSHQRLGTCRGSGVLVREQGRWKIAQYNLSMPVPNAMISRVASEIRSSGE